MKLVTPRSGAKFCVLQVFATKTYHFDQFSERFRSGDLQLRWIVDAAKRLEICCLDYFEIVFGVAIRHSVEKLKSGSSVILCVLNVCKKNRLFFGAFFLASIRPCVQKVREAARGCEIWFCPAAFVLRKRTFSTIFKAFPKQQCAVIE